MSDDHEAQARTFRDVLRQTLDDSVMTHTGRSIGDLASGHVADDVQKAMLAAGLTVVSLDGLLRICTSVVRPSDA